MIGILRYRVRRHWRVYALLLVTSVLIDVFLAGGRGEAIDPRRIVLIAPLAAAVGFAAYIGPLYRVRLFISMILIVVYFATVTVIALNLLKSSYEVSYLAELAIVYLVLVAAFFLKWTWRFGARATFRPSDADVFSDKSAAEVVYDALLPAAGQTSHVPGWSRYAPSISDPGYLEIAPEVEGTGIARITTRVLSQQRPRRYAADGAVHKDKIAVTYRQDFRIDPGQDTARVTLHQVHRTGFIPGLALWLDDNLGDTLEAIMDWIGGRPTRSGYGLLMERLAERASDR